MVINRIQYGMKQSIVDFLAVLMAPVELLAESRFAVSPKIAIGIATALNSSRSSWQRLDALTTIPSKESPACN